MKTEFPILNISPTQWVLVDKTRIPLDLEPYLSWDTGTPTLHIPKGYHDNEYCVGLETPILGAYPKIEGVLLLPSLLWEKPSVTTIGKDAKEYADGMMGVPHMTHLEIMTAYKAGFNKHEAAGGYTREQMIAFANWIGRVTRNYGKDQWGGPNDDIITTEQLFNLYEAGDSVERNPSPRSLVIEVGEDGSLPSENGAIIYTEAIY